MGRRPKNRISLGGGVQETPFPETKETPKEKISADASEKKDILEAAKKIPEIFTPEQVEWVFDVYVGIICFAYSIILKTDFKALQKELEFDKEQKKHLSVPLARILSKHAPASWAANSAEIELIVMMGVWTVSSFKRAKNVADIEVERKKQQERTRPVSPINNRQPQEAHIPA